MLRRLFFLFPNELHAQRVVNQLLSRDIPIRRIHAITHGSKLKTLPQATQRQKDDTAFRIEWLLWNANLIIFLMAVIMLIVTLVAGEVTWALASLVVMAITFVTGEQFVVHIPDVHLSEFTDALSHGEILLLIDLPSNRVSEIEDLIHHKHPEAAVGGVCWSVDAFGL